MPYDFSSLKQELSEVKEWLSKEFSGIRTGRAAPVLLDSIQVEVYGSRVPLNQVGNISVEDARTLQISVWDSSQIKEVEKAISDANLGVGVSSGENGVRVTFPELTSERREQLKKLVRDKFEHARVSVRSKRDEVWNDIQKQAKGGEVNEDEKFHYKDSMQKLIDDTNKQLEALTSKKEQEISN